MLAQGTSFWLVTVLWAGSAAFGQNPAPSSSPAPSTHSPPSTGTVPAAGAPQAPASAAARKAVSFDEFVDSAIRQERRLTELLRYFQPVVETYVQEEQSDSKL